MYDDHFYCEVCDKHQLTCWCRPNPAIEEALGYQVCQNPKHYETTEDE